MHISIRLCKPVQHSSGLTSQSVVVYSCCHASYQTCLHTGRPITDCKHLTHKSRSNSQHHLVASQQYVTVNSICHNSWHVGFARACPSALYIRLQAGKIMKPMPAFLATAGSTAMPHTSTEHTKTIRSRWPWFWKL